MIDYTTTALIASVKRKATLPNSQQLFKDADILAVATEEMQTDTVPLLMAVREDYLVAKYDQSIDTTVSTYALHRNAIGGKLRDLVLLDSNSREVSLPRLNPDELKKQSSPWLNLRGFYFEGNNIIIYPDTSALGAFTMRQKFFRRPNDLVPVTDAGQITAINRTTKKLTLANCPSTWAITDTFDIIKGTPGFDALGEGLAITAVDATTKILTFSATLPTTVAVNDWVALSSFSPIPQLPFEAHNLLYQRTVIKILEALGDNMGLQAAADVYKDMRGKFEVMVAPRADGSPKRFVRGSQLFRGGARSGVPWW